MDKKRKELREFVEQGAKGTIGYMEANDKESFMVGLSVGFNLLYNKIQPEIEQLEKGILSSNSIGESYKSDLITISEIINRYTKN